MDSKNVQIDRFKEAARSLQSDEDEARWDDRLRKVAAHKPKPDAKGK